MVEMPAKMIKGTPQDGDLPQLTPNATSQNRTTARGAALERPHPGWRWLEKWLEPKWLRININIFIIIY